MAKQRLLSLDIVRGITVAGMILVNNGHGESFEMLSHARWNGLTLCDFVFPFFLFIIGVSIYLSFSRRGFNLTADTFRKIAKRTLLLFLIGLAINWFDKAIGGNINCFGELRIWAVMQRIALCYFLVSMFALTVNARYTLATIVGLLIAYAALLIAGNGYSTVAEENLLYRADEWLVGYNHMYHKSPVDPEGLLGTADAVVNVLLGFYCAMKMSRSEEISQKIISLLYIGAILTFCGFLLHFGFPFNKRIWSPSFTLITSGFCALLLGVVMNIVDARQKRGRLTSFFEAFGVNALILYVASEVMAILFGEIGINDLLFNALSAIIPMPQLASLAYALIYVMMNFAIGYPLWRKRIYIKL